MKRAKYAGITGIVVAALFSAATAQDLMPGMIDMRPMTKQGQDNIINDARNRILAGGSPAELAMKSEYERVSKIGAAKIKAGNATTRFSSSMAGTQSIAKALTWDAEQPTLESQVSHIQKHLKNFETLMQRNGYTPKDFSDGYAFAKALSYAAYHNQDMDKAEVQKTRDENRRSIMATAAFQGSPDTVKQYHYELSALMAMQAAEQRAMARRATNETERQHHEEKAKQYANYLLKY